MSGDRLEFTPVVILGAGRSGTNALRNMLTHLDGFATWNCDEINPIWRHGNIGWPNDEIPPEAARPAVRRFIRGAFARFWRSAGKPAFVVEKTCANTLRVPFVDAILPEARYIHIVRDGRDVVASAGKRWSGQLEVPGLPYFAAKARYVPLSDLPIYGWRFLRSRLGMLSGRRDRLSVWGPRYEGMEADGDLPLDMICARQWVRCVGATDAALARIEPSRHMTVRYEDLARDPQAGLAAILGFLGVSVSDDVIAGAVAGFHGGSVGKAAREGAIRAEPLAEMAATLTQHGYDT